MTLEIDLPAELETKLRAVAAQQGLTLSELALGALQQLATRPQAASEEMTAGEYLLHLATKHSAVVPEAEQDVPPRDYAKNYKHYLYGHPKEQE